MMRDPKAYILSAVIHLSILALLFVNLPFKKPMTLEMPPIVPIEVVTIDQITQSPKKKEAKREKAAKTKKIVKTRSQKKKAETVPPKVTKPKRVETPPKPKAKPLPAKTPKPKDIIEKVDIKPIKTKKEAAEKQNKKKTDLKKKEETQKSDKEKSKQDKNDDFTSVLRAVQELSKDKPDDGGQEKAFKSDNISDKLTISELDALRQQIQKCWNIPAGARNIEEMMVEAEVTVNEDATVEEVEIKNKARMLSDSFYRTVAESAKRALFSPDCTPLKLPKGKYDVWKNFTMTFNPKEVL